MSFTVEIAVTARVDIQENARWLRNHRSPAAAGRWLAGMLGSIHELVDRPLRHPVAEENDNFPEEIRQKLHGRGRDKYRILFTIRGATIVVLYVRHAARDELSP